MSVYRKMFATSASKGFLGRFVALTGLPPKIAGITMKNRTLVGWLAVGHLANDWPIASLWIIVPAAGIALDLSPSEVGLLFTLFSIGGAVTYLPFGLLADRAAQPGHLLTLTFWWVAVGCCLAAAAPGYWSLAILLALAGMGNAAWHPLAAGVTVRQAEGQEARALGVHAIGGSAAEAAAPLAAGLMLAVMDWRLTLVLAAVPTFLMGAGFFGIARKIPSSEARAAAPAQTDSPHLFQSWREPGGTPLMVTISLHNMALTALLSMVPLYLADIHRLPASMIGLIFSGLLVTGALVQPFVGALSDRIGRRPVLACGNLIACAGGLVLIQQPALGWIVFALAVAVAAGEAIRSALLAAAVDRAQQRAGGTLGLAFTLMEGVGALGAVLAGIAAELSWVSMFGLVACLFAGAAALSWLIRDTQ